MDQMAISIDGVRQTERNEQIRSLLPISDAAQEGIWLGRSGSSEDQFAPNV